jgi:hypothetical protein
MPGSAGWLPRRATTHCGSSSRSQLRKWIEDELASGASQAVVAQHAGIGLRTMERWLAGGRPAPPEDDSWRIAASLLERAFPERWSME